MIPKKKLIVEYQGTEVNLWDFYDERGKLLVEPDHVWKGDLILPSRSLSDAPVEEFTVVDREMPDLSFLHVTGDVDVSANTKLRDFSKLPQQIDGNLYANGCYSYEDTKGFPSVGKNAYLINTGFEMLVFAQVQRIRGDKSTILSVYPLKVGDKLNVLDGGVETELVVREDEIVRENLPVKGKIFTPMGYARWQNKVENNNALLSERIYQGGNIDNEREKQAFRKFTKWTNENDPQSMHMRRGQKRDKDEREAWEAAKAAKIEAAKLESERRAAEEALKEVSKESSANHTRNTSGARAWAEKMTPNVPVFSHRKQKKDKRSLVIKESEFIIAQLTKVKKGQLNIEMDELEVQAYLDEIVAVKRRVDNYVRGSGEEGFPILKKLLELKKAYLAKTIEGVKADKIALNVLKRAREVVGYFGAGERKQAKKDRIHQEKRVARVADTQTQRIVTPITQPIAQQMPKRDNQDKVSRADKKDALKGFLHAVRGLYALGTVSSNKEITTVAWKAANYYLAQYRGAERK